VTTPYSGAPGNITSASPTMNVPVDGDSDSAATFTVGTQKVIDYLAAMTVWAGFSEGFEATAFPPTATPGWTTPSARYGSDLAWVRSTSSPLFGSAHAAAPSPQGTTTNSSLGLSVLLTAPARVGFYFTVKCNTAASDHLDFYVDGVLFAQYNCTATTATVTGRYMSDPLTEGVHTFDWRFVRGGSASIAGEVAAIDQVQIIPESRWGDQSTRVFIYDEFAYPATIPASLWAATNSGNAGTFQGTFPSLGFGVAALTSSATAIGDWEACTAQFNVPVGGAGLLCFLEGLLSVTLANSFTMFGVWTGSPTGANLSAWVYDSSVSANWFLKSIDNGSTTRVNEDSGVAAVAGNQRLGLFPSNNPGTGPTGIMSGMINGKAVPGAGKLIGGVSGFPLGSVNNCQPFFLSGSKTSAGARQATLDYFKCLGFRWTPPTTGLW
jgi:hypothetical protein